VLPCVTVCYSVLQCVTVCYSVLQCVTVCYSVLPCVAVCYRVLQCVACLKSALSFTHARTSNPESRSPHTPETRLRSEMWALLHTHLKPTLILASPHTRATHLKSQLWRRFVHSACALLCSELCLYKQTPPPESSVTNSRDAHWALCMVVAPHFTPRSSYTHTRDPSVNPTTTRKTGSDGPILLQKKRLVFLPKRQIFPQKSPVFLQKSPVVFKTGSDGTGYMLHTVTYIPSTSHERVRDRISHDLPWELSGI